MSNVRSSTAAVQVPGTTRLVPAGGWIIGAWADFFLFLGTPLLLLVLFGLAERFWNLWALTVFATVLALGHYLPGLMRAYGDPALFRRFRWRFVIAPAVFISLALFMANRESHAFLILVVAWGSWHWLMQTYGLVRIYDAKAKNFDSTSARLDYAMCISWFGVLYWHTDGATALLRRFYKAGGWLPPEAVSFGIYVWWAATLVISAFYVLHLIRRVRAGSPPSPLKLALLGITFFYYLYAFGYSSSPLVAYALFEGYHDIQYLAIVWVFNRNRAAKDPGAGAFTKFLFRQRTALVLLYVFMCVGFGSYDYFAKNFIGEAKLAKLAIGLITGFALVHFYFDGFIWRIRESDTRKTLDVESDKTTMAVFKPRWRHAMLWAVIGVPLLLLGLWERSGAALDDVTTFEKVLEARPDSCRTHLMLTKTLRNLGRHDEALAHARKARELRPGYDECELLYANLRMALDKQLSNEDLDEIISCYENAAATRYKLVPLHLNWGNALRMRGRTAEAAERFQVAMDIDPNNADTYFHLAKLLMAQQKLNEAAMACDEAIRINPDHVEALAMLATIRDRQGRTRESFVYLRRAIRVDPSPALRMSLLAVGLATVNDESLRNPTEAIQLSERATQLEPSNTVAWNALAVSYAALGRFEDAIRAGEQALELCRTAGQDAFAAQIAESLVRYRNRQP